MKRACLIALLALPLGVIAAACTGAPADPGEEMEAEELDIAESQAALGVTPASNFWPLPSENIVWADEQEERAYWWKFRWTRGDQRWHPADPPGACPPGAQHDMFMSAVRMADGAYSGAPMISINMLKQSPCAYWYPRAGVDRGLRWYTKGFLPASGLQVNGQTVQFLSFRGWSEWSQRTHDTVHSGNETAEVLGKGFDYAYTGGARIWNVAGCASAEDRMPPYAVVPDRPVDVDIVIAASETSAKRPDGTPYPSSTLNTDPPIDARYCWYSASANGWSDLRSSVEQGSHCPGGAKAGKWVMHVRSTQATHLGKPIVYVGFWEQTTDTPGGVGVCEEWWFAKDIGPVYLVQYPLSTRSACKQNLAISNTIYPPVNVRGYQDPANYVSYPDTLGRAVGSMALEKHCVTGACQVDYL